MEPAHRLRVCTLNLAHGRGRRFHQGLLQRRSIEAHLDSVAHLLRTVAPDAVAFQEADGPCLWSGGFDHVAYVARRCSLPVILHGHHARLGGLLPRLRYGCAIIAGRHLEHRCDQQFRSAPPAPAKGFVAAALRMPDGGGEIDVVSCHLDPARPAVRRRQAVQMIEALHDRGRPIVLMGDMNTRYFGPKGALSMLCDELRLQLHHPEATNLATYPSRRPRRRLDWILCSRDLRVLRYEVRGEQVSDHCAVVADLAW